MTIFAVEYVYGPEAVDIRAEHRPAHREWVASRAEEDVILASGPYGDGSGALIIFKVTSESSLRYLLAEDPMSIVGGIAETKITEWSPVIGELAGHVS